MKTLKIVLILCLLALLTCLIMIFLGASYDNSSLTPKKTLAVMMISIGLGIFLGIMAFLYHLLSFRYYKKNRHMQKIKKVPAFFIVCTILSHIYFLLISVFMLAGSLINFVEAHIEEDVWFYPVMLCILVYAVLGIIETTVFKKRIQQYKADVFLRDEIDTIGLSGSG